MTIDAIDFFGADEDGDGSPEVGFELLPGARVRRPRRWNTGRWNTGRWGTGRSLTGGSNTGRWADLGWHRWAAVLAPTVLAVTLFGGTAASSVADSAAPAPAPVRPIARTGVSSASGIVATPAFGVRQQAPEGGRHGGLVATQSAPCPSPAAVQRLDTATAAVIAAIGAQLPALMPPTETRTVIAASQSLCSALIHASAGGQTLSISINKSTAGEVIESTSSAPGLEQVQALTASDWSVVVTVTSTNGTLPALVVLLTLAEDYRLTAG